MRVALTDCVLRRQIKLAGQHHAWRQITENNTSTRSVLYPLVKRATQLRMLLHSKCLVEFSCANKAQNTRIMQLLLYKT